jgi:two-component system chemotaxis response regulator CheV
MVFNLTEQDKAGILLETGTNEFEIVEFTVGEVSYGINVAKVREIIKPISVTKLPGVPPIVEGVIELRGRVMPLVNLGTRLEAQGFNEQERHIIVCEFNQTYIGFLVNTVLRIHRISWERMEPVPETSDTEITTGLIKMDGKLIVLLDFERILTEVSPEIAKKLHYAPQSNGEVVKERMGKRIIVAEDSKLLRNLLTETLRNAGYSNLSAFENGKLAWDELEKLADRDDPIDKYVNIVITDIEMPQMDGHHLLKKIKEHDKLKALPVFIFSSLINEEMRRKGEGLGADFQITKPEIEMLIDAIDKRIL